MSANKTAKVDRDLCAQYDLYEFLNTCGFTVGATGGGCTAWWLSFPNSEVLVACGGLSHELDPESVAEEWITVACDSCEYGSVWCDVAKTYEEVPRLVAIAMSKAMNYRPEEGEE